MHWKNPNYKTSLVLTNIIFVFNEGQQVIIKSIHTSVRAVGSVSNSA